MANGSRVGAPSQGVMAGAGGASSGSPSQCFPRRWKLIASFGLLAVLVPLAGRSLAYQITGFRYYVVPTSSMAPTILSGDRIRVDEGSQRGEPHRGEVWVFYLPATAGSIAVKRVIGLPGETVQVTGARVIIDGKALAESYPVAAPSYTMVPLTLGPDEYFMLGDNRNMSHDSHVWGPLPRHLLLGRARQRFWPPRRVGGL